MPAPPVRSPFSYTILRAVPSVERGECVNVGVVVFCRQRGFLGACVELDDDRRLRALGLDGAAIARVGEHLQALLRVADGDPEGGPIAALDPSDRFGWLAAPQSTIIQPSPVHTGLSQDPEATLLGLHARLVAPTAT